MLYYLLFLRKLGLQQQFSVYPILTKCYTIFLPSNFTQQHFTLFNFFFSVHVDKKPRYGPNFKDATLGQFYPKPIGYNFKKQNYDFVYKLLYEV